MTDMLDTLATTCLTLLTVGILFSLLAGAGRIELRIEKSYLNDYNEAKAELDHLKEVRELSCAPVKCESHLPIFGIVFGIIGFAIYGLSLYSQSNQESRHDKKQADLMGWESLLKQKEEVIKLRATSIEKVIAENQKLKEASEKSRTKKVRK